MGSIQRLRQFNINSIARGEMLISVRFDSLQGEIGEETLRLDTVQGTEQVSQPFEFQLEMRADDFSEAGSFRIADFLGRPAVVKVLIPQEENGELAARYFNGIVTQFTIAEPGVYRASIKPQLWKASLTNRYKVYQNKNIKEVIEEVLKAHDVDYEMHLDGVAVNRFQDWLQAGETDLDLIQRLMQKASIYYYFIHQEHKHIMLIANQPCYQKIPNPHGKAGDIFTLRYTHTTEKDLNWQQYDILSEYQYQEDLTCSGVDYLLARSEAAWEADEIAGYSTHPFSKENVSDLPFRQYKVFQYGGSDSEAEGLGNKSWAEIVTSACNLQGSTTCPLLSPGYVFQTSYDATLIESPEYKFQSTAYASDDRVVREGLQDQPFVVTQVQHKASISELYSNSIQARPAGGLISPFSIQNTQQGSILAKVVATGGATPPEGWKYRKKNNFAYDTEQAIDTDSYSGLDVSDIFSIQEQLDNDELKLSSESDLTKAGGAAQVQEDIASKEAELESKVSEAESAGADSILKEIGVFVEFITDDLPSSEKGPVWIKLSQTMQTVPEVGVVVYIGRSSDESEMPEVQGIVQTNGNKVIMPSGWTANTSVGSNYSTSYGDSKGIRFGLKSKADLDAAKKIIEDAYNTGNYKDSSFSQGAGYNYSTSENGKDGLLSSSVSYGSTEGEQYAAYTENYSEIGKTYSKTIIGPPSSGGSLSLDGPSKYIGLGKMAHSSNYVSERDDTVNGDSKNTVTTNGNANTYAKTFGNNYGESTTYGNAESHTKTFGNATSTNLTIGIHSNMSTFVGINSNMNTFVGMKNDLSINVSMNNCISISAALNMSLELNGAIKVGANITATVNCVYQKELIKSEMKTTPLEVITESANVKCRIGNIDLEIMTFKIFM